MVSVDNGTTASYWYRADGRLVESNVAGTVTSVFYDKDGHNVGYWYGNGDFWASEFVPFGSRPLASYRGGVTGGVLAANLVRYYHPNPLGSTTVTTNYNGAAEVDRVYYPWGQVWQDWDTLARNDDRYAGIDVYDSTAANWVTPRPPL